MNILYFCGICGAVIQGDDEYMIFPLDFLFSGRQRYRYGECVNCGCVQFLDTYEELDKLYNNNKYSSFRIDHHLTYGKQSSLERYLMRKRFEYVYFQKSKVIGWALNKIKPGVKPTVMPFEEQWDFRKKILDVGCGAGTFICQLRKIGFEHVSGIDPFISFDTVYPNGISVEKKRITDLDEQYDIVYSHDVFEHVDDPAESLTAMRKCLKPGGVCIMVFPGVNAMYKRYKKDSYVIQAPQHYFLHSYRSLEIVAAKAGLKVASMKCEGNYLWYLKSELLVQETAFGETDSSDELEANFAQKELTKLKRIAQEDTQTNTGDGYSVLLVPTR